jgi:hypothetical protein
MNTEGDAMVIEFILFGGPDEKHEGRLKRGSVNILRFLDDDVKEIRKTAWERVRKKIEKLIKSDELHELVLDKWDILGTMLMSSDVMTWEKAAHESEIFLIGIRPLFFDTLYENLKTGSVSNVFSFIRLLCPGAVMNWLAQHEAPDIIDSFTREHNNDVKAADLDNIEKKIADKARFAINENIVLLKIFDIIRPLMLAPYSSEESNVIPITNSIFDKIFEAGDDKKDRIFIDMVEGLLKIEYSPVFWGVSSHCFSN